MASLNKSSVREEVSKLKAEFEQLSREGKITPESLALLKSLFLVIELILSVFLERQTKKTGKNSSLPSSQTDKDDTALTGSKRKGRGFDDLPVSNRRTRERTTQVSVDSCTTCGEPLDGVAPIDHERRTKIDIVFEKVVEHVDAEVKQCPHCATTIKGRFPDDMPGPIQYGNGLKAFAINLLVTQMVALNRVQTLLTSLLDVVIAEATLLKFVMRLHHALEGWEQQAIEALLAAPSMHVDETSLRVDKQQHWIHVYASGEVTLKRLHRRRGKVAMEAIDLIPRYGGVIVHDCWSSYLSYDHCGHALCGSHLLRELTFIIDSNGYTWARRMKRLLRDACKQVAQREAKCLTETEQAKLQRRYRTILTQGEKELPPIPPRPSGKRGRLAKSDAHNLLERLQKHEDAVLLFARNSQVPFTNNRAERDLRMAKVKQKVSGCFRAEQYAHAYCRISSYLQTMANKGVNPLVAIQIALASPRQRGE